MGKVSELQEVMDRQSKELLQMKERVVSFSSRVSELEEDLDTARKDLIKSEDMNTRLQRDIREVMLMHKYMSSLHPHAVFSRLTQFCHKTWNICDHINYYYYSYA